LRRKSTPFIQKQIESVQDGLIGASSAQQPVELADAFFIEANDFAVDDSVAYGQFAESRREGLNF